MIVVVLVVVAWCAAGEPLLPAEHHPGAGDQTAQHPPGRVQHVHEGGEGHAHPGAAAGDPVCHLPLETREPASWRSLRVHHAHPHALPG